ncbi:MAG: MBL fold metallo-hydrolase [Peptococcaceae bacterium]|nr:MBL fold metallo-hydrolase [Peptococcaceae bacterium]
MKSWTTHKNKIEIIKLMDMRCNCYLVRKGNIALLVDTSISFESGLLFKRLEETGVNALHGVLLTHVHFDHAGNVAKLQEKYGCPVFVHSSEEAFLREGSTGIPKGSMALTKIAANIAGDRDLRFPACCNNIFTELTYRLSADPAFKPQGDSGSAQTGADSEQVDSALEEKEPALGRMDLVMSWVGIQVLHTPGHTVGSVCFIVDDEAALVGDTMINPFRIELRPPFMDFPDRLIVSWKVLLDTHCRYFLPAHGTVVGRGLLEDNYTKLFSR